MNIRSPEERYGGEGHAGTDPQPAKKPGRSRDAADSSVEVPNATVEELIAQPASAAERTRQDLGSLDRRPEEPTALEA
jgi:hypothetical protein